MSTDPAWSPIVGGLFIAFGCLTLLAVVASVVHERRQAKVRRGRC